MPKIAASTLSLQPFGKYVLVAKLAEEGMAEIYLAVEQTRYAGRRFVVIKRMRRTFEGDPDYTSCFLTEARVALQLSHPNLPMAYELGLIDDSYYLAIEFIRGPTLLDMLRRSRENERMLSLRTCVTVTRAIAAALDHAHNLHSVDGAPVPFVHRDVTPQNTLVGYDGSIKLIDFGVAHAGMQPSAATTGTIRGKFSYLAPERIDSDGHADHRADIFSLGVMLHESLLGRVLFRGRSDRDTIRRVRKAPIPNPSAVRPQIPPSLSHVVLKALARDPEQRYASAAEFLAGLEEVADRAQLGISVLALRKEVRALWGAPHAFTIPALSSDELDLSIPPAVLAHPVPEDSAPMGLAADRELRYFLTRAGSQMPSRRVRRLRTTAIEFADVLASLDSHPEAARGT